MTRYAIRGAVSRPSTIPLLAVLALTTACGEEMTMAPVPDVEVEASTTAFASTDPAIGTDETIEVEIRNAGSGTLDVSSIALQGTDAADFSLLDATPTQLGAGASTMVTLGFAPTSVGAKVATLVVTSDDPDEATVELGLTGEATRFQFTQVDRKGIPALNTVFNHPSGTAGFDKTAYNVAAPSMDVASYRDQFITVLGAVGNADPAATADLLLPDELPVSLAGTTSFATLTGRALADDATDVALFVTVGDPSLQSDNVDANDVAFRADFPYVAPPHN